MVVVAFWDVCHGLKAIYLNFMRKKRCSDGHWTILGPPTTSSVSGPSSDSISSKKGEHRIGHGGWVGKPWEHHRKSMEKYWEIIGRSWEKHGNNEAQR